MRKHPRVVGASLVLAVGLVVGAVAPPAQAASTWSASELLTHLKADWRTSTAREKQVSCEKFASNREVFLTAVVGSLIARESAPRHLPAAPVVRRGVIKLLNWGC